MARRGDALREHILDTAKVAFLESGFSGTSMDGIATRARTSKRSLYAHFATKDALFVAVVARMRELFDERLLAPGDYSDDLVDAITLFCARLLQLLRWSNVARTLRIGVAEAERLPEVARGVHDAFFVAAEQRLRGYLGERGGLEGIEAEVATRRILGGVLHPALPRVLFGLEPLREELGDLEPDEVEEVRSLAGEIIAAVMGPEGEG